ncbi:MAG: ABC transporter ATP-binding protein [Thermoproteota archaeon]
MNHLLKIENLHAGYGKSLVIYEFSMFVEEGEIVGIIGPNGSGKSTVLKSIWGLSQVFNGKILFQNVELTKIRPDKIPLLGIAYVPQIDNVFTELTVYENLEMGGTIYNNRQIKEKVIEEIFELFPALRERRNQKAVTLSGGERQMLAIGRALVSKPKLMLLDEPAASLSPKVAMELFNKLKEINEMGTTLIIVEQDVRRVLSISNRGYVLVSGRKVLEGDSTTILKMDLGRIFLGH